MEGPHESAGGVTHRGVHLNDGMLKFITRNHSRKTCRNLTEEDERELQRFISQVPRLRDQEPLEPPKELFL